MPHLGAFNIDCSSINACVSVDCPVAYGNHRVTLLLRYTSEIPLDATYFNALTHAILHAELWPQLHLRAHLDEEATIFQASTQGSIALYLKPEHANTGGTPKGPHGICFSLPENTVQFRACDAVTNLQCTVLTFEIKRKKTTKIRKLAPSPAILLSTNIEMLENKGIGERKDDRSKAHKDNNGELLFDEDTDMILTGDDLQEESSCLYGINSHDKKVSDMADMMRSDRKNAGSALPPRRKKRTLSGAFSNVETSHFIDDGLSVDDFIGIVDAAFRFAICDKPNKLRTGIKIHGNTMKHKLQTINPTVWSPGYAQAVATRAALVPTLASSFSKFVSNARTVECETKPDKISGGQKTVETISELLLETTQRGLHDPKAARKLKPLRRKSVTITTFDSTFDDCESHKEQ